MCFLTYYFNYIGSYSQRIKRKVSVSSSWKAFPKLKREAKCSKKNKNKWKKMLQQHQNRWKMSYVIIICLHFYYDWLTGKLLFIIVCSFFQSQVWGNLEKLLECKKRCLENAQKSEREDTVIHREPGTETLVL